MTLQDSKAGLVYTITQVNPSPMQTRFTQLGFAKGSEVRVVRRAPIFKYPVLVRTSVTTVMLSREESALIGVEIV